MSLMSSFFSIVQTKLTKLVAGVQNQIQQKMLSDVLYDLSLYRILTQKRNSFLDEDGKRNDFSYGNCRKL